MIALTQWNLRSLKQRKILSRRLLFKEIQVRMTLVMILPTRLSAQKTAEPSVSKQTRAPQTKSRNKREV